MSLRVGEVAVVVHCRWAPRGMMRGCVCRGAVGSLVSGSRKRDGSIGGVAVEALGWWRMIIEKRMMKRRFLNFILFVFFVLCL